MSVFPTFIPGDIVTATASGDVTRRRFVDYDGTQLTSAGADAFGVAFEGAEDGNTYPVVINGEALVEAGDAVSPGDEIATDNTGRAVPAVSTDVILGKARSAATDAGQPVKVHLMAHPVKA